LEEALASAARSIVGLVFQEHVSLFNPKSILDMHID
jgi:hypothetical protein